MEKRSFIDFSISIPLNPNRFFSGSGRLGIPWWDEEKLIADSEILSTAYLYRRQSNGGGVGIVIQSLPFGRKYELLPVTKR